VIVRKQSIYHYPVGVNGLDQVFRLINEKSESKQNFDSFLSNCFIRFLIHPKPAPPRRDVHLHHVIINEKLDEKISTHRVCHFLQIEKKITVFVFQVSELPFPFANVEQFESILQQPLGREWNPETAYRRLNQPKVRTRIGVRIEPLNKQDVFLKQNHSKDKESSFDFNLSNNDQEKDSSLIENNSLFDHEQNGKKKFKKTKLKSKQ
jgi:hypothetical protein